MTGHIYRAAYKKLKVFPHDIPVTIPCYMVKLTCGMYGYLSMEPFVFTNGLWNRSTPNKPEI